MVATYFEENQEKLMEEFFTLLKFESISSEPDYKNQVISCCQWLTDLLVEMGMTVEVWESKEGHPCIFAELLEAGEDQPTLLLYNHYDVQPVDPLDLWDSPPFEPAIRNGQVFARGAEDNKGQLFYTLQALRYLLKRDGKLPINIKWIIEGEEETGSHTLGALIKEKKERLAADYLAIVDMGVHDIKKPVVNIGVRGLIAFEVMLKGSSTDLHSGSFGGIAYNPNRALVEILGKLYDEKGRVAVPHFYDEVKELDKEAMKLISFDFDAKSFLQKFGLKPTGGEKEFSPYENAWLRPTLEINGMNGGYSGEGFKTVIPAVAKAKLSCRLVPAQVPEVIGKRVADYIKTLVPAGIECTISFHSGGHAVRSNPNSPVVKAFLDAYTHVFKKPCGYTMEGGSIPIASTLNEAAGSEIVLLGLGLPDDNIHAPNEHFGIDRLNLGMQIIVKTLENLKK